MIATQQLREEHEGIQVVLSVLETLAADLRQRAPVDTEPLGQILDFLRTFADKCHHGKEEELLFPALGKAGIPTQGGPIGVMLAEHTQGRAYIREMGAALERLRAGEDAGEAFAESAFGYVDLLRAHIHKENNILFVMAEQYLLEEDLLRLAAEFEQLEQTRIGAGVHEQYHALIHALRDAYLKQAA